MTITPTAQQEAALAAYASGTSLVLDALAGTGKTSTLKMMSEADPNRVIVYTAFNKALVTEAKAKFGGHVQCRTMHSLTFASHGKRYKHRLDSARQSSAEIARRLRIDPIWVDALGERKCLQPGMLAAQVMRAAANFCNSVDPEPSVSHFPYIEGIDVPGPTGPGWANNRLVREALLPALRRAWDDWQDPAGQLRFSHDAYLKMAERDGLQFGADVVMMDEYQDASPVMASLVAAQDGAQIVVVGDDNQAIYSFRGAIGALAKAELPTRLALTRSFRFGPEVAEVANVCLEMLPTELRVEGSEGVASRIDRLSDADAVLCRTNAAAVSEVLCMQKDGVAVHLVGGGAEVVRFARAADELSDRGFTSWTQVLDYVSQDAMGGELRLMVRLVDEFGTDTIVDALEHMIPADKAETVVGTAHKFKGLQASRVRLAGDFPTGKDKAGDPTDPSDDEMKLLYVAVTRAQHVLDPHACGWLAGHLTTEPTPAEPAALPSSPAEPVTVAPSPTDIATLRAEWTAQGRPADHAYIRTVRGVA